MLDEPNLEGVLLKNACEVPNPTGGQLPDMSKTLVVKVTVSPSSVPPGTHADVLVTYTNKSTYPPLPLYFTIDPMPRFDIEVYNAKGNRVDLPKNPPPPLPSGMAARSLASRRRRGSTSRRTAWRAWRSAQDAVRTRWAPEKLKGTPPEKGYPRAPAGPLLKGKYSVKVITPLTNVFEGIDHEVSAPRVDVVGSREVGRLRPWPSALISSSGRPPSPSRASTRSPEWRRWSASCASPTSPSGEGSR